MKYFTIYILIILFQVGFVNTTVGFGKDLDKVQQQYKYIKKKGTKEQKSNAALLLADQYRKTGDNKRAIYYYTESIKLGSPKRNKHLLAKAYSVLGEIYTYEDEPQKSIDNYQLASKFYRLNGDKTDYLYMLFSIAEIHLDNHQPVQAFTVLKPALVVANTMPTKDLAIRCYELLSYTYEQAGDKEKALQYERLHTQLLETEKQQYISNVKIKFEEEERKTTATIRYKERIIKKKNKALKNIEKQKQQIEEKLTEDEKQIAQLNDENYHKQQVIIEKESRLKAEVIIRNISIAGFLMIVSFISTLYKAYQGKKKISEKLTVQNEEIIVKQKEIEAQKNLIETKNKHIYDSIRYAEKIQTAILPVAAELSLGLPENFVIYQPKDVVSGDFYWFAAIEDYALVGVADCTGHGIPGAFMSMIGNTLLNDIVNNKHIYDPAKILEQVHMGVRSALQQDNNINDDGIDMCLCLIHKAENMERKVVFSGAKRPLYVVEDDKVQVIKGDPKSVGGRQKEDYRTFTNHELTLNVGTMLYLSSDGFADQNNEANDKYGTTRLLQKLGDISMYSPATQQEELVTDLKQYQGQQQQRDDITLIGIRV